MTHPAPYDPSTSSSGLRAALLAPPAAHAHHHILAALPEEADVGPPPSPPELLDSSPNLQRLCESYHRTYSAMVWRSRRQRIGVAAMVSAIGVSAMYLNHSGLLNASAVANLVLTVAGASAVGLAIMAILWMRDDRRLKANQGERLLRAIAFNCALPAERLAALRLSSAPPTRTFFDCYAVWRSEHRSERTGLAALVGGLTHRAA